MQNAIQAKVRWTEAVTSKWFETLWVCTEVVLEKILSTLVNFAEIWSADLLFFFLGKGACLCVVSIFSVITCFLGKASLAFFCA